MIDTHGIIKIADFGISIYVDDNRVIFQSFGCLYIYPAKDGGGAQVRSWVRADVAELDAPLHAAVSRWLAERWPFERVTYAERPPA